MSTVDLVKCWVNGINCALISIMFLFIMRQTLAQKGWTALGFRIALACVAMPYAIKIWDRVQLDVPTGVDMLRDHGILLLGIMVIVFHWKRFGRL